MSTEEFERIPEDDSPEELEALRAHIRKSLEFDNTPVEELLRQLKARNRTIIDELWDGEGTQN